MSLCVACRDTITTLDTNKDREGTLLDIFARESCPLCLLIAHLLTPLAAESLLVWSTNQPTFLLEQHAYRVQVRSLIGQDASPLEQYADMGIPGPYGLAVQRFLPGWKTFQEVGIISPYSPISRFNKLRNPERVDLRIMNQLVDADANSSGQLATEEELIAIYRSSGLLKGLSWFQLAGSNFRNMGSRARVLFGQTSNRTLDITLLRSLLVHCDEKHEICRAKRLQKRRYLAIRLIDVTQRCIVNATTASKYFALSYVWGRVQMMGATTENILKLQQPGALLNFACILPQTIKDAIELVVKLRERYLWVDRLCILQDDKNEKHSQITQMHEIYSAAYATIVQQSGSDANSSLPGVLPFTRSALAISSGNIDPKMVAIPHFNLQHLLQTSIHSSRGWTMQEVLLSHRCLHFFDKHSTFLCAEKSFHDFDNKPVETPDLIDEEEYKGNRSVTASASIPWQMNPLKPYRTNPKDSTKIQEEWLHYFEIYARIIFSYSGRQLTYQSDILAAFSGLSSAISQLSSTEFLLGTPAISFDLALLWVHLSPLDRRLDSYYENKSLRLPSWTWAAWTGNVTYNLCATTGQPSLFKQFNSYVKQFSIEGFSDDVQRRGWPPNSYAHDASGLFDIYERADRLSGDPLTNIRRPIGCLHFWSEEVPLGEIFWRFEAVNVDVEETAGNPVFPFLYTKGFSKRCGIIALPSSLQGTVCGSESAMSLVLLSECRNHFQLWPACGKRGGLHKLRMDAIAECYYDDRELQFALNVLLVKQSGHFVERIAFGQVYLGAWIECDRRRRYFRII